MAKLAAVVDSLESVAEPHRDLYVERDGKFVLDADGVEDVSGLKGALAAQKLEAKEARDARAALAKELADLKRTQEAVDKKIPTEELDRMRAEDVAARKPLEEENERLKLENRRIKLDERVQAEAVKHVRKESLARAVRDTRDRFDLTEDGAGIVVKDDAGKMTTVTLADFWDKTYRAEAPEFYPPSGANGGGAPGGGGRAGTGAGNMVDEVLAKNAERASAPNALRPQRATA